MLKKYTIFNDELNWLRCGAPFSKQDVCHDEGLTLFFLCFSFVLIVMTGTEYTYQEYLWGVATIKFNWSNFTYVLVIFVWLSTATHQISVLKCRHMICLGKYSFFGFISFRKYFFRFSQRTYGFWMEISLVLFFIVEFFSFNMANNSFIAIEMVQAIKKNKKKGNCETSLDERVVLNCHDLKIQKQYT